MAKDKREAETTLRRIDRALDDWGATKNALHELSNFDPVTAAMAGNMIRHRAKGGEQ